jgi:HK97 family phage major capsid protein
MTEAQTKELTDLITQMRDGQKTITTDLGAVRTGQTKLQADYDAAIKSIGDTTLSLDELKKSVDILRKGQLEGLGRPLVARAGQVSDGCAKWFGACAIAVCMAQGKFAEIKESGKREALTNIAKEQLGAEIVQRTAVATTDIPMPVEYQKEVVELVYQYGQFRKYSTVYPMGTLTLKLPKLTTSPTFGFISASASVGEKVPQISFVTFTANKAGGIVRVPSEIEADSIVALGAFLARYIARQMASWEDTVAFTADGSGTYNSITGMSKYADVTDSCLIQTASGNTSPDKITLANWRNLRGQVHSACLARGAYYAHPSMEALFVSYNTSATVTPYLAMGPNGPTLDGFPIRWVPVLPVYNTTAAANQYQALFGDMSYWYLGDRNQLTVDTSRDVYFATDEIGIRALERFDVEAMASKAIGVMKLAAS